MKFLSALLPLFLSPFVVLAQGEEQSISFLAPEDRSDITNKYDFSTNPIYKLGERRRIRWTDTNDSISIVLYQERKNDVFEYVFQNSKGIDEYVWNVGTGKNLKNGRAFFFQIFITGEGSPTATSRFFNITDPNEVTTTSSSSTTSLTSSSTTSTTSTATAGAITGSGTPTPTSSGLPGDDGGGMSTGAKVGLGVGIPIGVIAIALLAFFLIRRRRKASQPAELGGTADYTNNMPPPTQVPHEKYSEPSAGQYVPNAAQEQAGGFYKPVGSPNAAPSEIYTPPVQPQEMPAQRYA